MTARSSPIMFGRDDELSSLETLLGIGTGCGSVLLSGDAGVGKTRLLTSLRDRAVALGWQVHAGACLDFGESALPYLPFSVVVGRLASEQPELVERVAGFHPALDRLQPGRRTTSGSADGPATDRAELFAAVHALLEAAAREAPTLLVVEDVHWADRSTRDLLGYLFSSAYSGRVSIVASYRTDDLHRRHPLRHQVAEWARLAGVGRLTVGPLPEQDVRGLVAELAQKPLGDDIVAAIVRRAEGNAFFVEELVASDCGGGCLPGELADVLLVGLDRLPDEGRHVVRLASVGGRRVTHELLAAASDLPPAVFEAGIREAVEMNLLVAGETAYSFRHALLAEAVYDDLLPGERARLHRQYVAALADGGVAGTAAELARHAWRAVDLDRAVTAGIAAGDEALAVGGPDDAARHYAHVLELLSDRDRAARLGLDVARIVTKTADALAASGNAQRAVTLLGEHLARWDGSDEGRVQMLIAYADLLSYTESDVEPSEVSGQAVALAPEGSILRARALATHARLVAKSGHTSAMRDVGSAEAIATEGIALAERLGLGAVISDLVTTLSGLRPADVDLRGALISALRQAEATGAVVPALRARWLLARYHQDAADWDEAERWLRTLIDPVSGHIWAPYVLDGRWQLAIVRQLRGDWEEALALVAPAIEAGAPAMPAALLAPVRLSIRYARGEDVLDEAVALRRFWHEDGGVAVYSAGVELDVYADTADAAAAVALFDEVDRALSELWHPRFQAGLRLAAKTLAVLGRAVPASSTLTRASLSAQGERIAEAGRLVAKSHEWGVDGAAWRSRLGAEHLYLRWVCGEDRPAREDLLDAWEHALSDVEAMGDVVQSARVATSYATILRQLGERGHARELADRARETARALGWTRLLTELTASGAAPSSSTPAPAGRLTERECEILALVAEGRSNGEIARQLFISTKTVSVHVSNILAKLGAASRTEAAAIAHRDHLL